MPAQDGGSEEEVENIRLPTPPLPEKKFRGIRRGGERNRRGIITPEKKGGTGKRTTERFHR